MKSTNFSKTVINWYKRYGRHDLPWQLNPTAYRVWISEIMLQQTQVSTVIPYYRKFIKSFPSIKKLALANQDEVLAHWSGLGYYARARNLHKTAGIISNELNGRFPKSIESLINLPGIGRSTAGAILSLAMEFSAPILDGNVKRVLARFFGISGWPGKTEVTNNLWERAETLTPKKNCRQYNQAMMDLGATLCTRTKPKCDSCPLQRNCFAFKDNSQHLFPSSKSLKINPIRMIYMLIFENKEGEILLEKRPPTGIWGSLWSFPECLHKKDIITYCKNEYNRKIVSQTELTQLTHKFSHFTLNIKPLLIKYDVISNKIMETTDFFWYKNGKALPGGIPTPIAKLIKTLGQEND